MTGKCLRNILLLGVYLYLIRNSLNSIIALVHLSAALKVITPTKLTIKPDTILKAAPIIPIRNEMLLRLIAVPTPAVIVTKSWMSVADDFYFV